MGVNVFEIFAKIGLDTDDYEKGLSDSESKTQKFAQALGNGLKTAAKIGTAAVTAASTAVVALTKQSIESYAEYEQLIGGVQTLFSGTQKSFQELEAEMTAQGKTTTEVVAKWAEYQKGVTTVASNAANAYKTAGMSANEYMSTVTSFSASLIQSLGGDTAKAAEVADRAITDMSDNANKMGTDISMIQNAYQGFAKQNYTMLDNLKLGYGGTEKEMARLIKDASKMTAVQKELGIAVKEGDMSFGNIANAISVVQKNMGIMGTTAKEASETISGSASAMKASWQNLITGIADDNAEFDVLISNFTTSVSTFAGNIIPRIETALSGVGDLVTKLAPKISEKLPDLFSSVLPDVIEGASSVVSALANATPKILPAVINAIAKFMESAAFVEELIPSLVDSSILIVSTLASQIPQIITPLKNAALLTVDEIGKGLAEKLPGLSVIFENFEAVVTAATAAMIVYKGATAISEIIDKLRKATEGQTIAQTLLNAVMNANPFVLVASAVAAVGTALVTLYATNEDFRIKVQTAWESIKTTFSSAATFIKTSFGEVVDWFASIPEKFRTIGTNIVDGLKNGISNAWKNLKEWFTSLFGDLTQIAKDILGIASPSKVFKEYGKFIDEGLAIGIEQNSSAPLDEIARLSKGMSSEFVTASSTGYSSTGGTSRSTPNDDMVKLLSDIRDTLHYGTLKTESNIANARDLRRAVLT